MLIRSFFDISETFTLSLEGKTSVKLYCFFFEAFGCAVAGIIFICFLLGFLKFLALL